MEEYPEELRTPPVTLISVVGCQEIHQLISTHLHSQQPPINTLAFPDFPNLSSLFKIKPYPDLDPNSNPNQNQNPNPNSNSNLQSANGILKRDWLIKHRTRVPSLIAALFPSHHISGDPAHWLQLSTHLDNLKAVVRGRNIKLVLVIVQSTSKDEISEDRMIALRKRAEVDSKYVIPFIPNDASELKQSLNRLGSTFAELANIYYREEGRRIRTRVERKSYNSVELNIRYCFKVAVYAEFRRDWVEALRFYEDAYHTLREMIRASTRLPAIQRLVEIKTVAEQLHFKMGTLLLHGGKVIEAITGFRHHNASYKKLSGAPEVTFLHWEWMSRQFLVFGQLLETSSATIQSISSLISGTTDRPISEWELHPAYYYQLAAPYLKDKRSSLELVLSMSEFASELDSSSESVVPSVYVGQFARLLEEGNEFVMQPLTDEEYIRYALSEGKRFQDSFEIIALLKKSFESFTNLKVQRMASHCAVQIAREYFHIGDYGNAKQLFDSVAGLYRQEGWVTLLWDALGYLRECSRKSNLVKDFIEYSLEMAALPLSSDLDYGPVGSMSLSRRETIHEEVFGLVNRDSVDLEVDLVSPLRGVLLASVAFHEQSVKPGASTQVTISLLSQLPRSMEIDQLEVKFNQSACNFTVVKAQVSPAPPGSRLESASVLTLFTNKWLRLTYDITSEQSGKLECISVTASIGSNLTICCRAESPASMGDLPVWKFEDRVESFPTKDPILALSGQKAIQVEEAEQQVELTLGTVGPALVGERFIVPVTVSPNGHAIYSGELKINLVDARGGGLVSPREIESFSEDNHHVELLGISEREKNDDVTQTRSDSIKKIQHSFGLIPVPFLEKGESWACHVEMKWHRPKQVMLYVSLGYSPNHDESLSSPPKAHVHKSLQIEGKTAVVMSHRLMLPFRRDPLLLSVMKTDSYPENLISLPLNETSILIVSAKNCTEVALQLLSISVEASGRFCSLWGHGGEDLVDPTILVPGEEFKKVFSIVPEANCSAPYKLGLGTVFLKWKRADLGETETESEVSTSYSVGDVYVEKPPLVVSLECPPYAILGDALMYLIRIQNQTELLQEINLSVMDSQSFVLSGPHNDTIFVMPKSEQVVGYKLVPLASGSHQLPKVSVTAVRYSVGFQPSVAASTVFVFPSQPKFNKMVELEQCAMEEATIASE